MKSLRDLLFLLLLLASGLGPLSAGGQKDRSLPPVPPPFSYSSHSFSRAVDFDFESPEATAYFGKHLGRADYLPAVQDRISGMGRIIFEKSKSDPSDSKEYSSTTFHICHESILEDTVIRFQMYFSGTEEENMIPLVEMALSLDGGENVDAWIHLRPSAGRGEPGFKSDQWKEFLVDSRSLAHVSHERPNLGEAFLPENRGPLGDLFRMPLGDDEQWGRARIILIAVGVDRRGGTGEGTIFIDNIQIGNPGVVGKSFKASRVINFKSSFPDRIFTHQRGERVEYGPGQEVGEGAAGIIHLPPPKYSGWDNTPYASFQTDHPASLRQTVLRFDCLVREPSRKDTTPYIVYAVSVDGGADVDCYIVGGRIEAYPQGRIPSSTWVSCVMDDDSYVHVSGWRGSLGWEFLPDRTGRLGDLLEKSLGGEMRWADAQVLFVAAAVSNLDGPEETTTLIDNMETGRYEWNWEESVQSQLLDNLLDALPEGRHTVLFAPLVSSVGGDNSFLQGFETELVQELSRIAGIHLLPSSGLDTYLESHSTELQELTDAGTAMAAARALDADIVITGYTMKSSNIFTIVIRMMDAGTGEVLTVSHAVLPIP